MPGRDRGSVSPGRPWRWPGRARGAGRAVSMPENCIASAFGAIVGVTDGLRIRQVGARSSEHGPGPVPYDSTESAGHPGAPVPELRVRRRDATDSNSDIRHMATTNERRVTAVAWDEDGEIAALCNPDERWSPVYRDTVVRHLKTGLFEYRVTEDDYVSYVQVTEDPEGGEQLMTTPDPESANNLENLPETELETAPAS